MCARRSSGHVGVPMSRALITGGAGFVGRYLIHYLHGLASGLEIFVMDTASPEENLDAEFVAADVTQRDQVVSVFRQVSPDLVFHLASPDRKQDLGTLTRVNVVGTSYVLEAASTAKGARPRVILASSSAVYGPGEEEGPLRGENSRLRPVTHYGVSKAAAELVAVREVLVSATHVVVARLFNVIGPGQPRGFVCADLAHRFAEAEGRADGGRISVGRLDARRDFIDVRDVAAAFWALAQGGKPGEAYNICWGSTHSVQQIVDVLGGLSSARFELTSEPARPNPADVKEQLGDNRKIIADTGWHPRISLEESLSEMLLDARGSCC